MSDDSMCLVPVCPRFRSLGEKQDYSTCCGAHPTKDDDLSKDIKYCKYVKISSANQSVEWARDVLCHNSITKFRILLSVFITGEDFEVNTI